jgi:hypothetical protein
LRESGGSQPAFPGRWTAGLDEKARGGQLANLTAAASPQRLEMTIDTAMSAAAAEYTASAGRDKGTPVPGNATGNLSLQ